MQLSRRSLLTGIGAAGAGAAFDFALPSAAGAVEPADVVPFFGPHQAGISTPQQSRLTFAAFDVAGGIDRTRLQQVLQRWTSLAARLAAGYSVGGPRFADDGPADTGETHGMTANRLTVTVGFGPTLFDSRFGLAALRPAALADLPAFPGDNLLPALSGGDLCIQACADDEQVAQHAVRMLVRHAQGALRLRWTQSGFLPVTKIDGDTPRNLMGFKDGTRNVGTDQLTPFVWASDGWMQGGSYLVARRIRMDLATWDAESITQQDDVFGRYKSSGAAYGRQYEHDTPVMADLPPTSHVALAAPENNGGLRILRRGYSYVDTSVFDANGEPESGLFFLAYQADPRTQFVPLQQRLAASDELNEYITHVGSAVFACPPGVTESTYWGQSLFAAAL